MMSCNGFMSGVTELVFFIFWLVVICMYWACNDTNTIMIDPPSHRPLTFNGSIVLCVLYFAHFWMIAFAPRVIRTRCRQILFNPNLIDGKLMFMMHVCLFFFKYFYLSFFLACLACDMI